MNFRIKVFKLNFLIMKNNKKKTYAKPSIISIKIDNQISFVMMTDEGTIPDNPPWDTKNSITNPKNDPFKSHSA